MVVLCNRIHRTQSASGELGLVELQVRVQHWLHGPYWLVVTPGYRLVTWTILAVNHLVFFPTVGHSWVRIGHTYWRHQLGANPYLRAARVYHPRVALHASRCARCAALCPPSCATLRSDKKPSDPRAVWKRVGKKLLAKRNCCCFVVVCRRRESCSSKMWWRASLRREWAHSFTRTKCRCVCGCFLCALRLSYGGVAHNGCHPTGVVDHAPC